MDNEFILSGTKVYLRPLKVEDATNNYLTWLSDPEVMQGLATSDYTKQNLISYLSEKTTDKNIHFFAICDVSSDKHIGNIKLDFFEKKNNVIELGIMIGDKSFWGKGIGKEACLLVLDYAFDYLNIRKVFLAVYTNNKRAIELYKRLGFKIEGQLRNHIFINGKLYDKVLMGIFKQELK